METKNVRVKKGISKKRKSSWRKYSQVEEVEEYFQEKRIQERTGIIKSDGQSLFTTKNTDFQPGRLEKQGFVLRCHFTPSLDARIEPIRNPAPNQKKREKEKLKVEIVRNVGNVVGNVAGNVAGNVGNVAGNVGNVAGSEEGKGSERKQFYDIWGSTNEAMKQEDVDEHGKRVCKKIRVKVPSRYGKKPNENPAIPIPMPGTSYHPSQRDHQDLLMKAYEVEMRKAKVEKKIANATYNMFPTKHEAPTEETWLKEMSQGLPMFDCNEEDEVAEEQEEDGAGVIRISNNPPVRREDKKSEKERRKIKERKLEWNMTRKRKEEKKKDSDKFRIKSFRKQLRVDEMRRAMKVAWKKYEAERYKNVPKKLGKAKFFEPDLDLKLTNELQDSLRLLKPEGHILRDIVQSVQRRNMAPAPVREPQKRQKRYKPKVFEKPSHKAITL